MKRFITAIAILFIATSFAGNLQAQKIGHFNVDSLLSIWPAHNKVVDSLSNYHIAARKTAEGMYMLIVAKQIDIDTNKATDTPLLAQLRMTQLQQLQSNYETYIQLAEQEAQNIQASLVDTLFKQLDAAIVRVAKAKGYSYILDSSKGGQVMYANPADDVFEAIRIELNIPVPVPKPEPSVPVLGGR